MWNRSIYSLPPWILQSKAALLDHLLVLLRNATLTSGDFTHVGDGRVVRGDAAQLLIVWSGRSGQSQHQGKQALVPAKGLFGQLAANQRRVQGQVELQRQSGRRETQRGEGRAAAAAAVERLPTQSLWSMSRLSLTRSHDHQHAGSLAHLIRHPRAVGELVPVGDGDDHCRLQVERVTALRWKHPSTEETQTSATAK